MFLPDSIYILLVLVMVFELLLVGLVLFLYLMIRDKLSGDLPKKDLTGAVLAKSQADVAAQVRTREKELAALELAGNQAREIMNEAVVFSERYKEQSSAEMDKYYRTQQKILSDLAERIKTETSARLGQVMEEVKGEMIASTKLQAQEAYKQMSGAVDTRKREVEEELAQVRSQRLKELDEGIIRVVEAVGLEVIGRNLTIEQHQQLVLDALKKAKRENVL